MSAWDDEIEKAIHADPLLEAEKITGKNYKDSSDTSLLGMIFAQQNAKDREALLSVNCDTHFRMTLSDYKRVISKEGFKELLVIPFRDPHSKYENMFYVWYNDELGILLRFDTYKWSTKDEHTVNSSDFYYNWLPHLDSDGEPARKTWKYTSSGHLREDNIWVGGHDGREALCFKIRKLKENGSFVPTWVECPFIWLLHFADTKDPNYDYRKINEERILKLPESVQLRIKGTDGRTT